MVRENLEHLYALALATFLDLVPEHHFFARLMLTRPVNKTSTLARLVDGPTGEDARHLGHILLGVATVDAEGVQLHQLTSVVLVESAATFLLIVLPVGLLLLRSWRARHGITAPKRTIHSRILPASGNPARRVRVRTLALPVVKIEQHRRALCRRDQQVLEFAQHTRPDDITLVRSDQIMISALTDEDVEVVEPEIGEHFFELTVAVNRAQQLG